MNEFSGVWIIMGDRSCVALIEAGNILMVRQMYNGEMISTFPGGRIECGKTPQMAAIRETQEETGLEVEIIRLVCKRPRMRGTGTYYCFLGRVKGGSMALGSDPELPQTEQELKEVAWIPLEQVKDHPEVAPLLATATDARLSRDRATKARPFRAVWVNLLLPRLHQTALQGRIFGSTVS